MRRGADPGAPVRVRVPQEAAGNPKRLGFQGEAPHAGKDRHSGREGAINLVRRCLEVTEALSRDRIPPPESSWGAAGPQ